jgi:hypothetical protein
LAGRRLKGYKNQMRVLNAVWGESVRTGRQMLLDVLPDHRQKVSKLKWGSAYHIRPIVRDLRERGLGILEREDSP